MVRKKKAWGKGMLGVLSGGGLVCTIKKGVRVCPIEQVRFEQILKESEESAM